MRMKFASEAEAEVVFNKLPKEINGKPFVRDPADEGNFYFVGSVRIVLLL